MSPSEGHLDIFLYEYVRNISQCVVSKQQWMNLIGFFKQQWMNLRTYIISEKLMEEFYSA